MDERNTREERRKDSTKVVNYWFRETDDGSDTVFSFVGPHGLLFFEREGDTELVRPSLKLARTFDVECRLEGTT